MWYRFASNFKKENFLPKKMAMNTQYPQESLFFHPWHEDGLIKDDEGNPKVLYHGSLSPDIKSFDLSKGNPNAYYGPLIYTTDNPDDANDNYSNPNSIDWSAKVEELTWHYMEQEKNKGNFDFDKSLMRAKAEDELINNAKPNTTPLYGKMKNPAYLFQEKTPREQIFEMYNYDEESEEYIESEGDKILSELVDLLYGEGYGSENHTVEEGADRVREYLGEEFTFHELRKAIDGQLDLYDYNIDGNIFFQQLIKNLGHDGIIIDAENHFPEILDHPTKHYMFFEPSQVKSPFNSTFDPKSPQLNASSGIFKKTFGSDKNASMIKTANEYWFHDGFAEFADGDIGDKNHEMIAEDYILREFIAPLHESQAFEQEIVSKDSINDEAPRDFEFLEFLQNKHGYTEEEAIDDAYYKNYITWMMTGDDVASTPATIELFEALKDPRKYVIENYGWIRVHDRNIETYNLDSGHLRQILTGIYEVFDDPSNMSFNISTWSPSKYLENVPFGQLPLS